MNKIFSSIVLGSLAVVVLTFAATSALQAQQAPAIKRTVLLKHDSSVAGREEVLSETMIPPGVAEDPHTHPGDLLGFVRAGTLTLDVEGQPTVTVPPGKGFFVEAGKVHKGTNNGKTPVEIVASFNVEKGKPLTSPAMAPQASAK
jgi:quercetin dioxygenase-like cupin family protein